MRFCRCAAVALALGSFSARLAMAQSTELISVSINGGPGNDWSVIPDLSPNGSFVAFASKANDLVQGDMNGAADVFLLDRSKGVLEPVSVDNDENLVTGYGAALSADGRYVVFASASDALVGADTNGAMDVFVRDRLNGNVVRVSVSSSAVQGTGGSGNSYGDVDITDDGRFVAFSSDLEGLVDDDLPGGNHVYLHDRDADEDGIFDEVLPGSISTTCVSKDVVTLAASVVVAVPSLSNDGNRVGSFVEWSNPDGSVPYGAYVHDRTSETTRHIGSGAWPRCTRSDGRYWVFSSNASDLIADDLNGFSDVFIYDYDADFIVRPIVGMNGTETNGNSFYPSITRDGRFVAFTSLAFNLVPNDDNNVADVFIYDRDVDGDTVLDEADAVSMYLASVNSEGQQQFEMGPGPCWCFWVMSPVSDDGRTVAFVSQPGSLEHTSDGGVATPVANLNVFVHVRNEPAACPGDLDATTSIDAADLQTMLVDWGTCFGCEAELDGDNVVGPGDLAALLAAWGACP